MKPIAKFNITKSVSFFVLFTFYGYFVFASASEAEKTLKSFRTKTGTVVIKCGPESKDDIKSLPEALSLLKKGSILQISPGNYTARELTIAVDGVIIEGERGKFCDISINITSKGCLVRNIWLRRLTHKDDLTIIDSVINNYVLDTDCKADVLIANSCFRYFYIYHYNKKVQLLNCTICSPNGIYLYGGAIKIEKSIVYSLDTAFKISSYNKVKLTIVDSLIYGAGALGADTARNKVVVDLKNFKDICNFTKKGNILTVKPLFESDINAAESTIITRRAVSEDGVVLSRSLSSCIENLKAFVLKEDSPAKKEGYGALLDENGFPKPN